jgi:hypothetical protein
MKRVLYWGGIDKERERGRYRLNGNESEREERRGERKGCIEGRRERE